MEGKQSSGREGGLTTVECRGAVDISRHERRLRLLSNRVVPHPADPTLEEGAGHSERQQIHNKLNIATQWVDSGTQQGSCNQKLWCSLKSAKNKKQTWLTKRQRHWVESDAALWCYRKAC